MSYAGRRPSVLSDAPAPSTPDREPGVTWSLPGHIAYRTISPRNVQFVAGNTPRACPACWADHPARTLIRYRGRRLCTSCFAVATARDRAAANARLSRSFADRALAYLERTQARTRPARPCGCDAEDAA